MGKFKDTAGFAVALLIIPCLSVLCVGWLKGLADVFNVTQSGIPVFPVWLKVSLVLMASISFYTDRYQAITYELSKWSPVSSVIGVAPAQMFMSPSWLGILGWLQYPTLLAVLVIFWIYYIWWIGLLVTLVWLFGSGFLGRVIPIPPISVMVKLMLSELQKEYERQPLQMAYSDFAQLKADIKGFPDNVPKSLIQ